MLILEKYNKAMSEKDEAVMKEVLHDDFKFTMHASGNFLTKATAVIATLFIICSLALTIVSRGDLVPTSSVLDKIDENSEEAPEIPENNN